MNINEWCIYLSTFGGLGRWIGGGFLATLWALALVLIGKGIYLISPVSAYWVLGIFLLSTAVIVAIAAPAITIEDKRTIILGKLVGMVVAFAGIPFELHYWKLLFAGFLLFHVLNFLKPLLLYNEKLKKLSHSNFFDLFITELMFGFFVNMFIRIGIWLFYGA